MAQTTRASGTQAPEAATRSTPVHQLAVSIAESDIHLRLHLTVYRHATVLLLANGPNLGGEELSVGTGAEGESQQNGPSAGVGFALGSFVYALPDITHGAPSSSASKGQVHSTPLYTSPSTHDLATRLARILASKAKRPTYVGCASTLRFWSAEDESLAVRSVIEAVLSRVST